MSRSSSCQKQQQWQRDFQQQLQSVRVTSVRSNVKAFIAGHYVIIKFFGKTVPLPGVAPTACANLSRSTWQDIDDDADCEERANYSSYSSRQNEVSYNSSSAPRTPEENRRRHAKRKQVDLQLLIHTNFTPERAVFATLTYQEPQRNVDTVIGDCQKFFKRLMRHVPQVKYVAVPERHENGGWHVHILLDRELPLTRDTAQSYIDDGSINTASGAWQQLWKHGFVHQKRLNQGGNLGASIAGYVLKNSHDPDLVGHHTVWKSKRLEPPMEIYGWDAMDLSNSLSNSNLAPSYSYHCEGCAFVETLDVFEFCLDPEAERLNRAWWRIKNSAA